MAKQNPRNGKKAGKGTPGGRDEANAGRLQHQPRTIRKPDPQRMRILRNLPLEIKQSLTKEEADAFLFESTWPDSLLQKLKDYLVEDDAQ